MSKELTFGGESGNNKQYLKTEGQNEYGGGYDECYNECLRTLKGNRTDKNGRDRCHDMCKSTK